MAKSSKKMADQDKVTTQTIRSFARDLWIREYPIRYEGCTFNSKMTIVRLGDGRLLLHSPCEVDDALRAEIEKTCGSGGGGGSNSSVAYIVAPGNLHHLHVPSCQRAFPDAETYICPSIEKKRKDLSYDGVLDDGGPPPKTWSKDDLEQVVLRGNRLINEVAFLHKPSRTLVLVDSIENIGDQTPGTNWLLRFFWVAVFRMWNRPRPAPEYQMCWKRDRTEAREAMNKVLKWDFDKVILSHGDNITVNAKEAVRLAWEDVLESEGARCCF